jgi:lipopolysaccharide transport system permease protein
VNAVAGDETVYSADPVLRSPGRFLAAARADLRAVPPSAWRMWLRGVQARHRQSRLGYAWLPVPALATALTWVYLDDVRVVRFGDAGIPYLAYVLIGVVLWQTFTDALHAPLRRLGAARHVLTKARLPHEAWLAAGALDVAFNLLVRLGVLAAVLVAAGTPVRGAIVLAPLGVLALGVLGFAIGLALAPVGLLYDDVGEALTVATGLWFFLTPVVYPWPSEIPGDSVIALNPVTPVLVTTRAWATGAPGAEPAQLAAVGAGAAALLVAAWLVYRVARPHLVARL